MGQSGHGRARSVIAIVDSGPLFASIDKSELNHERSVEALSRRDLRYVIPALVVAEVTYFVQTRLGAANEAKFLRSLAAADIEAPTPEDWLRMAELVEQYADFPLGGTDASVVALAERLDTPLVVTLDQRHFRAVRPKHAPRLELLP